MLIFEIPKPSWAARRRCELKSELEAIENQLAVIRREQLAFRRKNCVVAGGQLKYRSEVLDASVLDGEWKALLNREAELMPRFYEILAELASLKEST